MKLPWFGHKRIYPDPRKPGFGYFYFKWVEVPPFAKFIDFFKWRMLPGGQVPDCPNIPEPPPSHQGLDHVPAEPRPQYQLLRKGEKVISKGARS